jgi:hypothetical protein
METPSDPVEQAALIAPRDQQGTLRPGQETVGFGAYFRVDPQDDGALAGFGNPGGQTASFLNRSAEDGDRFSDKRGSRDRDGNKQLFFHGADLFKIGNIFTRKSKSVDGF